MKIFKQLGLVLSIAFAGEILNHLTGIPIPGSIIGMVILLILLKTKVIRVVQIEEITDFMLSNITFFFIPVGVGIMISYKYLEGHYTAGISLILATTVIIMVVSGGVTEILVRRREKRIAAREEKDNKKEGGL